MQAPNSNSTLQRPPEQDWLCHYGNKESHQWRTVSRDGRNLFYRPLGIVEGFFDTDGTDYEGRADVTSKLTVEISVSDIKALREKISRAWGVLRYKHALLSARVLNNKDLGVNESGTDPDQRNFVVPQLGDVKEIVLEGEKHFICVGDFYKELDVLDFYVHLVNTSRAFDPRQALATLFVLPPMRQSSGTYQVHFVLVKAHQICDGLTIFRWLNSFIDLLNLSNQQLNDHAEKLCSVDLSQRLPLPQEDLYPPISGSRASQRWAWAITIVLRHTRRPPPEPFQNPLRRATPLKVANPMQAKYFQVLDYSRTPPLNTYSLQCNLSPWATQRLTRICREAGVSVGAGCFALVGIVMMLFYERSQPSVPLSQRLPFVGSFPVNPRPFLAGAPTTGKEDSLMLAFSDGLGLPFLPSDLPIEGRLKVLGRLAHRQLAQYQKRRRSAEEQVHLGSRSPSQLIPALYIGSVERLEAKAMPDRKTGINPQGAYPATQATALATCGVSSVGDRSKLIGSGRYDVHAPLTAERDLIADFRDHQTCVRVRDGEFLVGASGDRKTMKFEASCDVNAIDIQKAQEWKEVIENILEEKMPAKL